MSSFTGALILRDNDDGKTFTVFKGFRYYVSTINSHTYRDVRAGFVTDLASKPPLLRRTGKYNAPSVLHDALYDQPYVQFRELYWEFEQIIPISRKRCDEIFLEAMKVKRVNVFTAYTYYLFVRAFGYRHWKHSHP